MKLIKCKQAVENPTCGNVCCCLECDDRSDCKEVCSSVQNQTVIDAKDCEDAILEGTEMVAFESKAIAVIQAIADIASKKKELEDQDKKMREQLEAAMEQYNIKSFENELVKITYVEPTTKTTVDSKKLKEKHPDIYIECSKVSAIKGSVRITVK